MPKRANAALFGSFFFKRALFVSFTLRISKKMDQHRMIIIETSNTNPYSFQEMVAQDILIRSRRWNANIKKSV